VQQAVGDVGAQRLSADSACSTTSSLLDEPRSSAACSAAVTASPSTIGLWRKRSPSRIATPTDARHAARTYERQPWRAGGAQ
jgi:hypothetical protein